jgi:hypothetical protein
MFNIFLQNKFHYVWMIVRLTDFILLIRLSNVSNVIQNIFCFTSFRISAMAKDSAVLLMVFVNVKLYGAISHSPSTVCDTNIM